MSWVDGMRYRLQHLIFRSRAYAETDEELRFHLEMETQKNLRRGMSPRQARRQAALAFGGVEGHRERAREATEFRLLEGIGRDVRFATRSLWRDRSSTAVIILMLALGIGLNSVIVAWADAIFLRPLPGVVEGERLVGIGFARRGPTGSSIPPSPAAVPHGDEFFAFLEKQTAFESVGAESTPRGVSVDLGVGPLLVQAGVAIGDYFETMRFQYQLGRGLTSAPADDRSVVVSYRFWREHLGGSPAAVGRAIRVKGEPLTVVGVLGEAVQSYPDLWVSDATRMALDLDPFISGIDQEQAEGFRRPGARIVRMVGRLHPGRTIGSTEVEASTIAAAIGGNYDPDSPMTGVAIRPLRPAVGSEDTWMLGGVQVGNLRRAMGNALRTLLGTMLILAIACANASLLLVGRALARRREIAVRFALGASRAHVIRQLLIEGLLTATLAGVLGLVFMAVLMETVGARMEFFTVEVRPGWRTILVSLGVAASAGILFSLIPALNASRSDLRGALADSVAGLDRGSSRLQRRLIVGQFALAMLLTCVVGTLIQQVRKSTVSERGYEISDRILMADIASGQHGLTRGEAHAIAARVSERLRALPGVESVGFADVAPGVGAFTGVRLVDIPERPGRERSNADWVPTVGVSPGYFSTIGTPIADGRAITDADIAGARRVVVVSEELAEALWPGQRAVGRTLRYRSLGGLGESIIEEVLVVGVAGAVRRASASDDPYLVAYTPAVPAPAEEDLPDSYRDRIMIFVRSHSGDARALIPAVRREVARIDRDLPVRSVLTMKELHWERNQDSYVFAALAGGIGAIALLLAAAGIYATVMLGLAQRRREIAIRRALGAKSWQIVSLSLRSALSFAIIGSGLGLVLGLAASRIVFSNLPMLTPSTAAVIVLTLATSAALASWLPSLRATRVEPMEALRN